jgi:hypothetical protein
MGFTQYCISVYDPKVRFYNPTYIKKLLVGTDNKLH